MINDHNYLLVVNLLEKRPFERTHLNTNTKPTPSVPRRACFVLHLLLLSFEFQNICKLRFVMHFVWFHRVLTIFCCDPVTTNQLEISCCSSVFFCSTRTIGLAVGDALYFPQGWHGWDRSVGVWRSFLPPCLRDSYSLSITAMWDECVDCEEDPRKWELLARSLIVILYLWVYCGCV